MALIHRVLFHAAHRRRQVGLGADRVGNRPAREAKGVRGPGQTAVVPAQAGKLKRCAVYLMQGIALRLDRPLNRSLLSMNIIGPMVALRLLNILIACRARAVQVRTLSS